MPGPLSVRFSPSAVPGLLITIDNVHRRQAMYPVGLAGPRERQDHSFEVRPKPVTAAVAVMPVQLLFGDRSVEMMLPVGRPTDLPTSSSLAGHMRYDAPRMVQMQERLHVHMRDRQSREGPFT